MNYQPLNLYDNFATAAEKTPDQVIILDEKLPAFPELPLETTYQDSLFAIQQRAYQLAQLGVGLDNKVILFKSPKFDTYLLAAAVSYLGAVPVMISYHFPASTLAVFAERLEDPYIVYDAQTEKIITDLPNSSTEKQLSIATLLAQPTIPVSQQKLANDQISYMTHTSGTTGIPKLICHSANSMGWRTLWQRMVFDKISEKKLLAFHISPVHSRFNIGVTSAMAMGFPLMPLNNGDSANVATYLQKYRPIALETHPNNFVQWSFYAKEHPESFQSIRYYHSTFDAINNQTMARFLQTGNAETIFLQVYGQSECGPMILKKHTLDSLKHNDARDMGVGLADLTKARITDAKGQPLPVNTDGHIQFLSKGRALTYYKEDARFQETVYNEWWDSGDYGMIDEKGHLYLKDRQVDLIETINSNLAIEDYLLDRLDFLEEVVIVRNHKEPQPILAVAPSQEMNWEAWWQAIADLPRLKAPILRAFEDIPRTATMKVQRLQIEAALENGTF
ncbi:acyl-CoA synthetase [Enterococcus saccharolyticus]|uniref:class I adenylate-forming enzyme family protein n=1 Tax=Enterococcus saccharolyticus TaxID=41997 RepID=UPI001E649520|nr:AMP-binding protein [Enterococcus saccharolyticus]MCD5002147.1 acyl-CoA synthetase [Enterococcus saccharolyticus]